MSIYKRGGVYWYSFIFRGDRVQRSTRQADRKVARQMEAAKRTALAKGEVGIAERKPAPTLGGFAQRFIDSIQVRSAAKPKTIEFYAQQLARLLDYEPLANARLNTIDESLIERFVQHRSQQVSPTSVNRALATLRRLLRLAQEWHVIDRVPRVRLLPGEHNREFVLSHQRERVYLEMAPQPLHDFAMLDLDTGLRVGEALALRWSDIHLEPANGAKFGYLHVKEGKSRLAKRNVPLTARVRAMLAGRSARAKTPWVLAGESETPILVSSLDHAHAKLRKALKMPTDFVLHSLRHTYGTRLGEARADAFEIMRLMGHSSVTISQRYVHPSPEALEMAVERLESLNQKATNSLPEGPEPQPPATIPATLPGPMSVSH
jgi:integrase